jgi:hypothetical protein
MESFNFLLHLLVLAAFLTDFLWLLSIFYWAVPFSFADLLFQKDVATVLLLVFLEFFVEFDFDSEIVIEQFQKSLIFLIVGQSAEGVGLEGIPLGLYFLPAFFGMILLILKSLESVGWRWGRFDVGVKRLVQKQACPYFKIALFIHS